MDLGELQSVRTIDDVLSLVRPECIDGCDPIYSVLLYPLGVRQDGVRNSYRIHGNGTIDPVTIMTDIACVAAKQIERAMGGGLKTEVQIGSYRLGEDSQWMDYDPNGIASILGQSNKKSDLIPTQPVKSRAGLVGVVGEVYIMMKEGEREYAHLILPTIVEAVGGNIPLCPAAIFLQNCNTEKLLEGIIKKGYCPLRVGH